MGGQAVKAALVTTVALLTALGAWAVHGNGTRSHQQTALPPPGQAWVANLPPGDGLQYCINLRPGDLAPAGSRHVYVHSLSAFIATRDPSQFALLAIKGRYPGWDTPNTTIYNQQFSNTNMVWLEIIHEFPLGIACIEVYGRGLVPSRYSTFNYRTLVSYSYQPWRGPGISTTKLFSVMWGHYLRRYSPRHRPKH